MRPTAKWVAQRMRMKNFSWARLHEPDLNATLGTYYLKQSSSVRRQPVLAAAAYTPGLRARACARHGSGRGAIFVETIPFGETRDYVKKVMATPSIRRRPRNRAHAAEDAPGHGPSSPVTEDVKSTQNGSGSNRRQAGLRGRVYSGSGHVC